MKAYIKEPTGKVIIFVGEPEEIKALGLVRTNPNAGRKPKETKTCPNCQKEFIAKDPRQKYCKSKCRFQYNAEKQAERRNGKVIVPVSEE